MTMLCRKHPEIDENVHRCSRCEEPFCPDCLVAIGDRSYCADCKTEQLLDVRSGVDRLRMRYGRFWPRFGAQVLDALIWGLPAYAILVAVVSYVTQNIHRDPGLMPLMLAGYLPLYVFPILYEALLLTLKNGQTIGKMAIRLRVVRPDGSRITAAQAWGRAVLRVVLGCLIVVDFLPYFFTEEKTTLHDMVAGTRVVESG